MKKTLSALYKEGAAFLRRAGVSEAEYEARALLAHVLDIRPLDIFLHLAQPIEDSAEIIFYHLLSLRACRLPLPYITRTIDFYGISLRIDARAMIPRPETELLVEAVLKRLEKYPAPPNMYVVDIGCGSGSIGLALATQLSDTKIMMTDVSPEALQLAQENAQCLGLQERVDFLQGSYLTPLREAQLMEQIHAIVSNPPYVRPAEWPHLEPEVHAEPRIALISPSDDGLEAYRQIITQAQECAHLRFMAFEVGYNQGRDVAALACGRGDVEILPDWAGIERYVIVYVR